MSRLLLSLAISILFLACQKESEVTPVEVASPPAEVPPPPQNQAITNSTDGMVIGYTVAGSGSPALIFLHGWAAERSFWKDQIDAFSPRHQVITMDLVGHGESGKARDEWTLARLATDVVALTEELGVEQMILIGHAMGARVGLEVAQQTPQRVVGVIAIDDLQNADFSFAGERWDSYVASFEEDFDAACSDYVQSLFSRTADTDQIERTSERMCETAPEIAIPLLHEYGNYDVAAAMSRVEAPIRSINSTSIATQVEANRKFAPTFDAVLMEDAGHFLMLEKPTEFNRVLAQIVAELASRPAEPS